MIIQPNNIYHVYNQGNKKQQIFHKRDDYLIFLTLYKKLLANLVSTLAWCLMPNHFHFMFATDGRCDSKLKQGGIYLDPVTNGFRKLLSSHSRIYNSRNQTTGSLFRQKTKAKCLNDLPIRSNGVVTIEEYFTTCFHYIHQNPLKAKLVTRLEDWEFSSFRDYAGLRGESFCNFEMAGRYCGFSEKSFVENSNKLVEERLIGCFI